MISALLAGVRIYEFFADRRQRLSAVGHFRSDEALGNDILIQNASKTPVNIFYFELVRAQRGLLGLKVLEEVYSDDEYCNITVKPHSQHPMNFSDQNHFG